ncbi:anti-sigma B factor RsbW [Caldalkalibacillus salinus]|uniref:anti-sigma B factor RsbW n=1 Tax=Caldalkalibacillus salinus TaxID=2803787 RepID=UPI0019205B8C|nr:anti-sigma B factor RsbW [Caldalkalibacillus salinus]
MTHQDFVELKVPAKPEYVGVVRLFLSGVASRLGFTIDEVEDIKLAVAEACTNATLHAYKEDEGQMIITCTSYDDRLEVMVIDHGESFEIDRIRYRLKPIESHTNIESLHEGGLGLFLIETLMDEVHIQSEDGIAISMTKYKRRDEVESGESSFKTTPSQ